MAVATRERTGRGLSGPPGSGTTKARGPGPVGPTGIANDRGSEDARATRL